MKNFVWVPYGNGAALICKDLFEKDKPVEPAMLAQVKKFDDKWFFAFFDDKFYTGDYDTIDEAMEIYSEEGFEKYRKTHLGR